MFIPRPFVPDQLPRPGPLNLGGGGGGGVHARGNGGGGGEFEPNNGGGGGGGARPLHRCGGGGTLPLVKLLIGAQISVSSSSLRSVKSRSFMSKGLES